MAEIEEAPLRNVTESESQIERAVLRLRELILKGEFEAGERVSEAPLTSRLGVSRTPIRLALERLAAKDPARQQSRSLQGLALAIRRYERKELGGSQA